MGIKRKYSHQNKSFLASRAVKRPCGPLMFVQITSFPCAIAPWAKGLHICVTYLDARGPKGSLIHAVGPKGSSKRYFLGRYATGLARYATGLARYASNAWPLGPLSTCENAWPLGP